jgi:hypothetical protein
LDVGYADTEPTQEPNTQQAQEPSDREAIVVATVLKMLSQGVFSANSTRTPLTLALARPKAHHPSVLSPTGKVPELSFADATSWLHEHNANNAAILSVPFPLPDREVDICIYDPIGMCLKVWNSGEMILTNATTMQNLIIELQSLIDRCCFELNMTDKYLILDIEMRVLNNGSMTGFPKLVGAPKWIGEERDGKKGALVESIVWMCDGGEMEQYWDAYWRMMQIGDAEQCIKKPMLKLRTLRKQEIEVGVGGDEIGAEEIGGHLFVTGITGSVYEAREENLGETTSKANRSVKGKGKVPEEQIDLETTIDNMETVTNKAMAAAAEEQLNKTTGNPLGITESEIEFALKICTEVKKEEQKKGGNGEGSSNDVSTTDALKLYRKHLVSGGKPMKELAMKKGSGKGNEKKSASTNPKKSWIYFQTMGGDPKMHAAFPLDRVFFEENESKKWVSPDDPDYPDEGNDQDTVKSLGEDAADTSIKMVPCMSPAQMAEAAELVEGQKIKPSFPEAAIGFDEEDDAIFCPKVDLPPSSLIDPKKAAALKALRGAAPQHKKVETLRAIGLDKILGPPVVPQSSFNNSAYLNALGSSGVAPPAGIYNSFSSFSTNQPSGFQPQNNYPNTAGQSPSPLRQWSNMSSPMNTPTLGFYDTMTPSGQGNMGMGASMGGMSSNLSNIVRSSSRMGFQSNTGTPLRADSPAFHSTASENKPTYPPPAYGLQSQQQQQHGGGFGQGGASGSATGGQQQFDYSANVDVLNAAAKKWFID